jgi:hypothetical protein
MAKRLTPHLSLDHRLLLCSQPLSYEETRGLIRAQSLDLTPAAIGAASVRELKEATRNAEDQWRFRVTILKAFGATPRLIENTEITRARWKERVILLGATKVVYGRWHRAAIEACVVLDRQLPSAIGDKIRALLF